MGECFKRWSYVTCLFLADNYILTLLCYRFLLPHSHQDAETTPLLAYEKEETKGQVIGSFGWFWGFSFSIASLKPGGKPMVAVSSSPPQERESRLKSVINTCAPFVWPRTWIQAYRTGCLDFVSAFLIYKYSDYPEGLENKDALNTWFFFLLRVVSSFYLLLFRYFAGMMWVVQKRAARRWLDNSAFVHGDGMRSYDIEEQMLVDDMVYDILCCPRYEDGYHDLTVDEGIEIATFEITQNTWPAFRWPARAYFTGLFEAMACFLLAYLLMFSTSSGALMDIVGVCGSVIWMLGRVHVEGKTKSGNRAYVERLLSDS